MTPERIAKVNAILDKRQNDLAIIMENVTDPHNIAAVMRTCDAVGISEIFVLNTKINTHKRFGAKSSSSAKKWVRVRQFTSLEECMQAVRSKYAKVYSTHLGEKSKSIYEMDFTQSCALVFGNESEGVSEDILAQCDGNFIIPQMGIIQSLNISVACAVTIYEAFRQKHLANHYQQRKLSSIETQELLDYWEISKKM